MVGRPHAPGEDAILAAADHAGLGFELEKPDGGFCTGVCPSPACVNCCGRLSRKGTTVEITGFDMG